MRSEPVAGVRPEVIRWARESIGMTVSDVAHRLKRSSQEIEDWEAGNKFPSYPQLEKLAYEIFKRPLAVFFLPVPPEETSPKREFRTLPMAELETLAVDTYLHLRRAHAYQLALQELFGKNNPSEHRIWQDLSLTQERSIENQAEVVRNYLDISFEEQIGWTNEDQALKRWRSVIEDKGVFIFKESFKQKDISGFCLIDNHFPVIYLNNSTSKTRQIFSLLHELTHLLHNVNGLSKFDQRYIEHLPDKEKKIEVFCNAIAAEILIPSDDFQAQTQQFPDNVEKATEQQFSDLAARYRVSREAVLRCFLKRSQVTTSFYKQKAKLWSEQKKKGIGGGDWYASKNTYLSERFAIEVVGRYYKNQISVEQAANFLGIKPKNFAGLEQLILKRNVA